MSDISKLAAAALARRAYDRGDMAFIIVAGGMVSLMVPGLAFLYGGLSRRKSALHLMWCVAASNAITIFQWYFWGYSLAFSPTATNGYIGNLRSFALMEVLDGASPGSPLLPELLYSFFQMEFACVTVAILMGAVAERGRVLPAMLFAFLWLTIVYCPLTCWVWNPNGWAFKYGVLDFAGGGPVEIGSGVGGLAYSWVLGRRRESELINFRPHNVSFVGLGTFILWFGWLGFNGGSAFGANLRAIMAIWNTMISAAFSGAVWCLMDYRASRSWSMVGFCSGTIAGLVAATPASGFIHPWGALILGVLSGAICNLSTKLKFLFRMDDALDLFAEHAMGGIIGLIFNALFGAGSIIALDEVNTTMPGGWLDHNWKQLYIQIAYVVAATAYTFVVTAFLAKVLDMIPGLQLRSSEESEVLGMDESQIGEFATDYVEVARHYLDGYFPTPTVQSEKAPVAAGDRHGVPETGLHQRHPVLDGAATRREENGHGASASGSSVIEEKTTEGLVTAGARHGQPEV
ncbi:ammonium transporter AmtB-like domain-containing protein [Schizophyllum commune]